MSTVELNDAEWGVLMSVLSEAPWKTANPLLMKIGEQLRMRHALAQQEATKQNVPRGGIKLDANGQEVRHE